MSWNYRAIKSVVDGVDVYRIAEVYYNEKGEAKYWTPSSTAILDHADSMEDLRVIIKQAERATEKPVLFETDYVSESGSKVSKLVEDPDWEKNQQ